MVSDKKIVSCFSLYLSLCKTCDPRGRAIFGPRDIIKINLVEVHEVMLHTKYQGSSLRVSGKKIFSCFPYIAYVKYRTPGQAIFGPRDMICINLVEVH